jgi:NADPH:quinone reductase
VKAIVRQAFGGPEQLKITDVPTPAPSTGEVLIRVRAFGLNRAEQYFRLGAWGDVHAISGIECVGEVALDPSGKLATGERVIGLMGGMGRSIAGSYAEYVCVSSTSVVPIKSSLPWDQLAALPESYATAWACLMDNLQLKPAQTLVIRGGGSALGQAAINIARHACAHVIATVRSPSRIALMKTLGAHVVVEENINGTSNLNAKIREHAPSGVNAVLDIVGSSTVLDSLQMLKRGGGVCMAGFLGGGDPIEKFNPIAHLPSGRHLSFFGSAFVFGTPEYPLSDIPFQQIIDNASSGAYQAKPTRVFRFDDIQAAHRLLDEQTAGGKIVMIND